MDHFLAFNECSNPADNLCDVASGAICQDLENGYKCNCGTGYILASDGLSCEGKLAHYSYTLLE